MQNPNVFVTTYPDMGRGMATIVPLKKGEFIMQCELLVLNSGDTLIANITALEHYTFKYTNTTDCLCLGNGELFNHSDTANVNYELQEFDGRYVMVFTALRDIEAAEQLFIDYSQDISVDADEYINSKSLIGG